MAWSETGKAAEEDPSTEVYPHWGSQSSSGKSSSSVEASCVLNDVVTQVAW